MWKDGNATLKHRVDETDELLKSTMKAVDDLEKECALWKAKSAKYKEMATRGHRLIERRSSVLPPGAASSDLQVSLFFAQHNIQQNIEKKGKEIVISTEPKTQEMANAITVLKETCFEVIQVFHSVKDFKR